MATPSSNLSRRRFLTLSVSAIAAANGPVADAGQFDVIASDVTDSSTSARHNHGKPTIMPNLNDNLPEVQKSVRTRPLFAMHLNVRPLQIIGATPGAFRRVGVVPGGLFEGERLSGTILEGGSDWQNVRGDGSTTLDVRLVLKTSDDALIGMTYRGLRHGPADVIAQIEKGQVVDPNSYYFRINPMFETSSPKYDWINRILAIGIGHRRADGPIYSVFEIQ